MAATLPANLPGLCALLEDCVEGGASVGFLWPMAAGEAEAYWRSCIAPIAEGTKVLIIARDDTNARVVGSGQLDLSMRANGRHRAEVSKLMVLRSARREGVGSAIMAALEGEAQARGRTTLFLDTREGDEAEYLYRALGWTKAGGIPRYALDPDGTPRANAFYYKLLDQV